MKSFTAIALALAALLPVSLAWEGGDWGIPFDIENKKIYNEQLRMCYPKHSPDDAVAPPCESINDIELGCKANGTLPLNYVAHAQCMCNGSFFEDWSGCQQCLWAHGLRSGRDLNYWHGVARVVSTMLCGARPTADFKGLFAEVQSDAGLAPYPTVGGTESRDHFPSQTAVSLYYEPTMSQGPGDITGEALSATKTKKHWHHHPHGHTTTTATVATATTVNDDFMTME